MNIVLLLLTISFYAAFVYGWVMNIVTLAHSEIVWTSGMIIVRLIGVVLAPLGAVMGFI